MWAGSSPRSCLLSLRESGLESKDTAQRETERKEASILLVIEFLDPSVPKPGSTYFSTVWVHELKKSTFLLKPMWDCVTCIQRALIFGDGTKRQQVAHAKIGGSRHTFAWRGQHDYSSSFLSQLSLGAENTKWQLCPVPWKQPLPGSIGSRSVCHSLRGAFVTATRCRFRLLPFTFW